jgi:hypothetical protein
MSTKHIADFQSLVRRCVDTVSGRYSDNGEALLVYFPEKEDGYSYFAGRLALDVGRIAHRVSWMTHAEVSALLSMRLSSFENCIRLLLDNRNVDVIYVAQRDEDERRSLFEKTE